MEWLEPRAMLAADLPDLQVWAGVNGGLYDVSYQTQTGGPDQIRFSNAIANVGTGPLEMYWGPANADNTQPAYQRVYNSDGTYNDYFVGNFIYHPTHHHTHFEGFAQYNLRAVNSDGSVGTVLATSPKISFCITDSLPFNPNLPGAPTAGFYTCSRQGISVGWADVYGAGLDGQSIDISTIPTGDYWLQATVNTADTLHEANYANNTAQVKIHIDRTNHTASVVGLVGLPNDPYENNDTMALVDAYPQAAQDSPNLGVLAGTHVYSNLTMNDAADYYRFETDKAAVNGDLVRIDFDSSQGDLDMQLLDANGNVVGRSHTVGNSETIQLRGKAAGVYYIKVYGYQGAQNPNYTMTIQAPAANGGIAPDVFEQNDSPAQVDARKPGELNSPNLGQIFGERVYPNLTMEDGTDWFKFQTTALGTSTNFAQIDFSNAQGNLGLRLRDSTGAVLAESNGSSDSERISLANRPGGTYYVEVFGANGALNPNYTLTLDVANGSGGFSPDNYEDNDTQAIVDSRPVGGTNSPNLGQVTGIKTITGLNMEDSADWYKFQTAAAGTSANSVQISFTNSLGNLNLELRDASGNVLATSAGTGNSESISLNGRAAGTYYVVVTGAGGAANPNYTLTLNTPSAPTGAIQPDVYEDNDSQAIVDGRTAGAANSPNLGIVAGPKTISNLTMEDGVDWYKFQTTATGTSTNTVKINFSHAQGDLDMWLVDANGVILQRSTSSTDSETVTLSNRPAGTYYIKVYGYQGATNPNYSLTINAPGTAPPPTIQPDAYEDNDTQAIVDGRPVGGTNSPNLGQMTGSKTISNLTLEDSADWYKFQTVATGISTNAVSIAFANAQGDLNLRLRNAAGTVIATSAGTTDAESISLNGLAAGAYYVEVYGGTGVTNPNYSLTLNTPSAAPGVIQPDAYEDNDTRAIVDGRTAGAANSPNLGQVTGARSISNLTMEDAADFYRFQTTATGTSVNKVTINFSTAQGDLDLWLLDANGNILQRSTGSTDSESVTLSGRAAGVYYVQVYGYRGASNPNYSLTINAPGTSVAAASPPTASLSNLGLLNAMADALVTSQNQRRSTQAATDFLFANSSAV